ncbi:GNAT family N-acetyltransferase [Leifsonia aquatica]|uniref:GNAT family N-acetyltransferase n=1 Tax=Leifsonia aquatica TaxID=144185 RepID=UPI0038143223
MTDLVWRPLTVSDSAAMADLLNAIDAEDHVWGQYTVEDAAEELESPVDDLPTSTLAVFDGATMVGFSAVHYKPAAEIIHRVQAAGAVRPTHRRRGLGTMLMRHGLETAQELHTLHHPTLRLVVESVYGEHVDGAVALYRAAGMTATKWSRHLRHPLGDAIPDAPIPDGLRIEAYTAETDAEFRAIRNEVARVEGRSQLSAEEWTVWAVNSSFRPESSFLLRDVGSGEAAGVVLVVSWEAETAATGVRDAYFRVIATRPAYEDRGVAEALISHALRDVQAQGYGRASLRADADPSSAELRLYESAGFVTHDTQVHYSIEL